MFILDKQPTVISMKIHLQLYKYLLNYKLNFFKTAKRITVKKHTKKFSSSFLQFYENCLYMKKYHYKNFR